MLQIILHLSKTLKIWNPNQNFNNKQVKIKAERNTGSLNITKEPAHYAVVNTKSKLNMLFSFDQKNRGEVYNLKAINKFAWSHKPYRVTCTHSPIQTNYQFHQYQGISHITQWTSMDSRVSKKGVSVISTGSSSVLVQQLISQLHCFALKTTWAVWLFSCHWSYTFADGSIRDCMVYPPIWKSLHWLGFLLMGF